jgi:hypothetical protein
MSNMANIWKFETESRRRLEKDFVMRSFIILWRSRHRWKESSGSG